MAAASIAAVTACGTSAVPGGAPASTARVSVTTAPAAHITGAAAGASASATSSSPACAPGEIGPVSASFPSVSDGYLLGLTLKGCSAGTWSKVVLRKTTDGGSNWTTLPAPPAPWGGNSPGVAGVIPADGVTSLLFADAENGWAYGPGLWATHDGGLTWHQIPTGGRAVQSMAATDGHVVASFARCDPANPDCDSPFSFTLESSPVTADAWRPVPGATGRGEPSLSAQSGVVYAAPVGSPLPPGHVTLLTGPADGSARWVSRSLPCQAGTIALSPTTASSLVLACANQGIHPTPTSLYSSADAGARWREITTLGTFDGAGTIERTADGTLLIAGIYTGIELSRDGGRTWTLPPVIDDAAPTGGGDTIEADLLTDADGYVIEEWGWLWLTQNGGKTWRRVIVR